MKKIKITAGDIIIPATLNDTVAAKDFETRLPNRRSVKIACMRVKCL